MTDWEEELARVWVYHMQEAYFIARGQARAALHGHELDFFDRTGIHMFSRACGIAACVERMLDLDPELFHWSPTGIKKWAYKDAYEELRQEVLDGRR